MALVAQKENPKKYSLQQSNDCFLHSILHMNDFKCCELGARDTNRVNEGQDNNQPMLRCLLPCFRVVLKNPWVAYLHAHRNSGKQGNGH